MKKIYFFYLLTFLVSQVSFAQYNYDKQWETVEKYELKGKFSAANRTVERIYTQANEAQNTDQIVKSFIYRSKFSLLISEDSEITVLQNLRTEMQKQSFPTNAILENIYARLLTQYLKKYQYKFRSRSIIKFDSIPSDIRLWDLKTMMEKIHQHFQHSLARENELLQLPVTEHLTFLDGKAHTAFYRASLYDVLLYNALDFYKTDIPYSYQSENYTITAADFAESNLFIKRTFNTDAYKISSAAQVISLFQKLEKIYQNNKSALVEIVLQRLAYAYQKTRYQNDSKMYLKALQKLAQQYENNPLEALIQFEIARHYLDISQDYHAKTLPDYDQLRIIAFSIASRMTEKYPNSQGSIKCKLLQKKIKQKDIQIRTEAYSIPNKSMLAQITHRNIDTLYFKAYKVSQTFLEGLNYTQKDSAITNLIKKRNVILSKQFITTTNKDFYKHTSEFILPKLPEGRYVITFSDAANSDKEKNVLAYNIIHKTNLSELITDFNNTKNYTILNRATGKPIYNAAIRILNNEKTINQVAYTDIFGEAVIAKRAKNKFVKKMITYNSDTLYTARSFTGKKYRNETNEVASWQVKPFVFTDRSIYRPGQTVHYKVVLIQEKNGVSSVVPNIFCEVTFESGNDELKTLRLQTNEFGSFSGSFKLPKNILTGDFTITVDEDYDYEEKHHPFWDEIDDFDITYHNVKVEEYKRPRFEVQLDPLTKNIKHNDTLTITGSASALLGSPITNATVKYTVTRVTHIPYQKQKTISGYEENKVIKKAVVKTDAKGVFTLPFVTEIYAHIPLEDIDYYKYLVTAEVTDINGETHSVEKTIFLDPNNIKLSISTTQPNEQNQLLDIHYEATDMNYVPIQTQGNIRIYKLKSAPRVFVKRPWKVPEKQHIPKKEFIENFPYFSYNKAEIIDHNSKAEKVFDTIVSIQKKDKFTLNTSAWKSGAYVIETAAYKEQIQDSVHLSTAFMLKHKSNQYLADNKLFDYQILNSNYQKEGYVKLKLATALRDDSLNVLLHVFHKENMILKKVVTIDKGTKIVEIPFDKKLTERITIRMSFVKYNTFYQDYFSFEQYQEKRYLNIETTTFRNKLQPGKQETWEFKILDLENKPSNAEVLASMYDASLDQFVPHEWNADLQRFGGTYYNIPRINANGFHTTNSKLHYNRTGVVSIPGFKNYLKFNWFGFNLTNVTYYNSRYLEKLKHQKTVGKSFEKSGNISGLVLDDSGLPLPGANILIKDTNIGTTTDFDGFYTINASAGETLVFSYVGFKTKEIPVINNSNIHVSLQQSGDLEEVIVVAYGSKVQSAKVASSVATIEQVPVQSLDQILQGQAAGINVTSGSGQPGNVNYIVIRGRSSLQGDIEPLFVVDGVPIDQNAFRNLSSENIASLNVLKDTEATALYGSRGAGGVVIVTTKYGTRTQMINGVEVTVGLTEEDLSTVETRKKLQETAFFYPHLRTDTKGNIVVAFEAPETLTRWKFQLLAHQKDGAYEHIINNAVTQKELMVLPNMPRFLREKDTIIITTKVTNLLGKRTKGIASLRLFDAQTMESIDTQIHLGEKNKAFTVNAKGNTTVSWKLHIPKGINAIQYKILAKAGQFADGEESTVPVLKNSILITEAKPVWVQPNEEKKITFSKLENNTSNTLQQHKLIVEYTSNPTWSALLSLPYLIEYPYECAEQTFSRLYANLLATHILQSSPEIKAAFDSWKANGALISDLEKNTALKSMHLAETPWVRDAISETARKQQIAQLFDQNNMENLRMEMWIKLEELQADSGGFPWFSGGNENNYITLHILQNFSHLVKLGVIGDESYGMHDIIEDAFTYADDRFLIAHDQLLKAPSDSKYKTQIRYIYTRTIAPDFVGIPKNVKKAITFYLETLRKNWINLSLEERAMVAFSLERIGNHSDAKRMMETLKETAVQSEEHGMYWKEMQETYHYTHPVETQALMIEAFSEITKDRKIVQQLQLWLLQQKQASHWATTKATTKAVYALMLDPKKFVAIKDNTEIMVGTEQIHTKKLPKTTKEAGTGYFKTSWNKAEVSSNKATITFKNKGKVAGYGAVYWQYFEELDAVKQNDEAQLQIRKELYIEKINNGNKVLVPIGKQSLKVGDLITVRLTIDNQKDIEFVHLKDMRASGLEPVAVLSGYKWQDRIGYYKSTRDASTNFFFDRIPKGLFVLEYELRVNNTGDFSNGVTTIESMYAPEFKSHTKGIRIKVK